MTDELDWTPPGPGPWQRDKSHMPYMTSRSLGELLPQGFARGFAEGFAQYGLLLDRMQPAIVNGFLFLQPQPFDMPGPDGPKDPEWIHAEFGRRIGVAAAAMEGKIWRDDLVLWDNEFKPRAEARHRTLWTIDLSMLTDRELAEHLQSCAAHHVDMAYQHHRFNVSALAPVGDFALQAAGMAGVPPVEALQALDGSSPVSGILSDEIMPAVSAIQADPGAEALVRGSGDPSARVRALRTRVPAVADWLAGVEYRLVDGMDITRPTLAECPGLVLGRLAAALDTSDRSAASARAAEYAAVLRARIPVEAQAQFDDLLTEARTANRLRDERGMFSDTASGGILRVAMLEIGRRLVERGHLDDPAQALEAGLDEILGLLAGAAEPTAAQLQGRTMLRARLGAKAAPFLLGPPPPDPPPLDQLPPPLARVMGAVGFAIEGVLGQMAEPTGGAGVVVGIGIGAASFEGRARVVLDFDDLFSLEPGEVLVTPATMESFNAMLHLVGAIVTDHGSYASHAAIMARELGLPAVVGTVDGTLRISTGDVVRVNASSGEVTVVS